MLSLPPAPPPLPPPSPSPSPSPPHRQLISTPLHQIVVSKRAMNQQTRMTPELPYRVLKKEREQQPILPQPRRTNPAVWCGAIICLIFSLLLIFSGIATLIIFLVIRPRIPVFDTPTASLNVIYFDSPEYFNGDFTFLANFTNPNRKLDVKFESLDVELYFADSLVAAQALQPFTQRPRETRLVPVHFVSSLVYVPLNLAMNLQKQVMSNKITYNIRGTFRVRVSVGMIHFSYWLHARCYLDMTSPPIGVLVARSCKTKR